MGLKSITQYYDTDFTKKLMCLIQIEIEIVMVNIILLKQHCKLFIILYKLLLKIHQNLNDVHYL